MAVWALGLNHNTAPLDLRGRFAFATEQMGATLDGLRQAVSQDSEVAILSTCNRPKFTAQAERNKSSKPSIGSPTLEGSAPMP